MQSALEIREIANAEAHRRRVELVLRERERERVTLNPLDRSRLSASAREHLRREIEADHPSAATLCLDRKITRPTARIEHAIARPHDLADGEPAPPLVETHRHHAVHHVVDGRDPIEHAPDRLRLESPRLVAHASPQRLTSALSIPI
jgi:hypothetical protein